MLDFIFAVSHPDHWHSINMHQNPSHYPLFARLAGGSLVSRFQNIPPSLWFNPYATVNGVVSFSFQTLFSIISRGLMHFSHIDDQIRRDDRRDPHLRPPYMADALFRWSDAQACADHQGRSSDPTHATSQPRFRPSHVAAHAPTRIHGEATVREDRGNQLYGRSEDERRCTNGESEQSSEHRREAE